MKNHEASPHHGPASHAYVMFAVNRALSFVAMYLLMFSMIDGRGDFRNNLNTVYMALTMVAPMGLLMLATMGGMYPNRRLNLALYAGFAVLFVAAFAGIRTQVPIGDRAFIASMIPHRRVAFLPGVPVTLQAPKPLPFPDNPKTLGEHLRKRCAFQKVVARELRVNQWTPITWETNRAEPEIRYRPRIIAFLGDDPNPTPETLGKNLRAPLSGAGAAAQGGSCPTTDRRRNT